MILAKIFQKIKKILKLYRKNILIVLAINPGGSVTLKMKTSGWYDVKKWLLGFGAEAMVVRPEELREEMVEELRAALERYG